MKNAVRSAVWQDPPPLGCCVTSCGGAIWYNLHLREHGPSIDHAEKKHLCERIASPLQDCHGHVDDNHRVEEACPQRKGQVPPLTQALLSLAQRTTVASNRSHELVFASGVAHHLRHLCWRNMRICDVKLAKPLRDG